MREASGIKELKGDSRSDTEDSTDGEALHGMEVSSGNPLKTVEGTQTNVCSGNNGRTAHQNGTGHGGSSVHHALYNV